MADGLRLLPDSFLFEKASKTKPLCVSSPGLFLTFISLPPDALVWSAHLPVHSIVLMLSRFFVDESITKLLPFLSISKSTRAKSVSRPGSSARHELPAPSGLQLHTDWAIRTLRFESSPIACGPHLTALFSRPATGSTATPSKKSL